MCVWQVDTINWNNFTLFLLPLAALKDVAVYGQNGAVSFKIVDISAPTMTTQKIHFYLGIIQNVMNDNEHSCFLDDLHSTFKKYDVILPTLYMSAS